MPPTSSCRALTLSWVRCGWQGRAGRRRAGAAATMAAPAALPSHLWLPPAPASVGIVGGQCFALDYYIERRSQCSYTERQGACPDAGLSGSPASNQVELVSCEQVRWAWPPARRAQGWADVCTAQASQAGGGALVHQPAPAPPPALCPQVGDVLAVVATRPLAATDDLDWAWPLDPAAPPRFTVWAVGPVSEGSNATQPVVLYHRLQVGAGRGGSC